MSNGDIRSGSALSEGRIAVFLCYRQTDGKRTAEELYSLLSQPPKGENREVLAPPALDVYFDQAAPGIGDWTEIPSAALGAVKGIHRGVHTRK